MTWELHRYGSPGPLNHQPSQDSARSLRMLVCLGPPPRSRAPTPPERSIQLTVASPGRPSVPDSRPLGVFWELLRLPACLGGAGQLPDPEAPANKEDVTAPP